MTEPTIVDTATAAVAAGVEPATIRDWARRGILPRTSRGRYDLAAVYQAKAAVRRVSSYTTKRPPTTNGATP